MPIEDAVVIAVIGVVLIQGLWLIVLTYLMWRRRKREREATAASPPAAPPPP